MVTMFALNGLAACNDTSETRFVRQETSISIQKDKPVAILLGPLSGGEANEVAIRCSREDWEKIAAGANNIAVRLVSADRSDTKIDSVLPGSKYGLRLETMHYLFFIHGERGTHATVEIVFPNAPSGTTNAEILLLKTATDMDFW